MTLILALLACSSDCGTSRYALADGSYVEAYDTCSFPLSFARSYVNVDYVTFAIGSGYDDLSESSALTLALTPFTELVFRDIHLEEGNTITGDLIAGSAVHDPSYSGAFPVESSFYDGSIEVLKGPRNENEWRLRWDITIGEPDDDFRTEGFQRHTGENWMAVLPSPSPWDADWTAPPDAEQ
jgi:hypothetical protein